MRHEILRKRLRRAGYTVVEVMMALAVLSAGATGIIAMQKATLIGNMRARNLSTATAIASTWLDRLKLDGLGWKKLDTGGDTIATTRWLNVIGQDFPNVSAPEGTWTIPAVDAVAGYSPNADMRGLDITDPARFADTAYCTHLNIRQILPNVTRVQVRVFWLRMHGTDVSGKYAGTLNGEQLCSQNPGYVSAVGAETGRYHFVYMSDAVMQNGANL